MTSNETCKYCEYVYRSDEERQEHSCQFSDREKLLKNINGMRVWNLYKFWRNLNGRASPNLEAFVQSRYYSVFLNLNNFLITKNVPDSHDYIKYCSKIGLLPNNWCMSQVFLEYLIHFDKNVSPEKQFEISKRTIHTLAGIIECEDNQVLLYLTFDEIAKLVHSRNISPWYLLFSKTFDNVYNKKLSKEEKIVCDSLINREHWLAKIRNEKENVKTIIQLAQKDRI